MRKVMFIVIAIISLFFVSNTFGQAADWEIKPAIKKPKTTIKKPKQTQSTKSSRNISNQKSSRKREPVSFAITEIELDGVKKPNTQNEKGTKPKGWLDGSFDIEGRVTSDQTKFQDGSDIILRNSGNSKGTSNSSRKTAQKTIQRPQRKPFYEDMMEGTGIRRKQP